MHAEKPDDRINKIYARPCMRRENKTMAAMISVSAEMREMSFVVVVGGEK